MGNRKDIEASRFSKVTQVKQKIYTCKSRLPSRSSSPSVRPTSFESVVIREGRLSVWIDMILFDSDSRLNDVRVLFFFSIYSSKELSNGSPFVFFVRQKHSLPQRPGFRVVIASRLHFLVAGLSYHCAFTTRTKEEPRGDDVGMAVLGAVGWSQK